MKNRQKILLILLFCSFSVLGQKKVVVTIISNDGIPAFIRNQPSLIDSIQVDPFLNDIYEQLHRAGYLTAYLLKKNIGKDSVELMLNKGKLFKIKALKKGNLPEELINKIDFHEKYFQDKRFDYQAINRKFDQLLQYTDNNGYPFASVKLDSINQVGEEFSAVIDYEQGPFITFDTIQIEGKINTKRTFLYRYLKIIPGKPFEKNRIDQALVRINRLPYLEALDEGFVTFQNNTAIYHLNLQTKKVNLVDGIIGVLPNEQDDGSLLVTGQFNLQLFDLFNSGKNLGFHWKRLKLQSQSLDVNYFHPNLLGSSVGLAVGFNLLKEDTTFLTRNLDIQTSLDLGKNSLLRFFANNKTSNSLSNSQLKDFQLASNISDFNLTSYGFGLEWNNLDQVIDPIKGTLLSIDARIGNKKISNNSNISADIFDSIALNTVQYQFNFKFRNYIPVGSKWVVDWGINAGKLVNERLFVNDLFRLGGLQSIRGFNENFFFASEYILATINLKFYFDEASHFLLFYDQMAQNDVSLPAGVTDFPSGVGIGINFKTDSGLFSFIYGLGRTKDQPFSFNLSKIHFGYTSRF